VQHSTFLFSSVGDFRYLNGVYFIRTAIILIRNVDKISQ